jgi:hypothetical protein
MMVAGEANPDAIARCGDRRIADIEHDRARGRRFRIVARARARIGADEGIDLAVDVIDQHRQADAIRAGAAEHDRAGDLDLGAAGGGADFDRAETGDRRAARRRGDEARLDVAALLQSDAAAGERE